MASTAKTQNFMHNDILPRLRRRYPNACMKTVPHLNGSKMLEVSLYIKIPEFDFESNFPQGVVEALAEVLERKISRTVVPTLSGMWIECDD